MLYLVECDFSDPTREADWNTFYSEDKLRALLSVSGFLTSQRFRCIHGDAPKYLAVHALTNEHVLGSVEYLQNGGGNFGAWQPFIGNWQRNLIRGVSRAPTVSSNQFLISSEAMPPHDDDHPGFLMEPLVTVDPGAPPSIRRFVVEDRVRMAHLIRVGGRRLCVYEPITEQLTADGINGAKTW